MSVLRALAHHLARWISWTPLLIALSISTVIVVARRGGTAATPLEAAAFLVGTAVAFAIDDPAHEILAASPTSLLMRRLRGVGMVFLPAAAGFIALVLFQGSTTMAEAATLTTMFLGLTSLGLAVSGIVGRVRGRGGSLGPPVVLALIIASSAAPLRWRLLPTGDVPGGFGAIAFRWGVTAVAGAVVFLWSSRDPTGREW